MTPTACFAKLGLELLRCVAADPACLPPQSPPARYLEPLVRRESRFNHLAVRDEDRDEGRFFSSQVEARLFIERRLAEGAVLGIGWGQGTWRGNWRRYGWLRADGSLDTGKALDPCEQLRALADHFEGSILRAAGADYNGGDRGRRGEIPAATRYGEALRRDILSPQGTATAPAPPPVPEPPPRRSMFNSPSGGVAFGSRSRPSPPTAPTEAAPAVSNPQRQRLAGTP